MVEFAQRDEWSVIGTQTHELAAQSEDFESRGSYGTASAPETTHVTNEKSEAGSTSSIRFPPLAVEFVLEPDGKGAPDLRTISTTSGR